MKLVHLPTDRSVRATAGRRLVTGTRTASWSASALAVMAAACGASAQAPAPATMSSAAMPAAPDPALGKRLDAAVDNALAEQRTVGVVVLIARDGKLVYERAAGFADREAGVAMREDTQVRLASMSKPIVSVAALALIDQGKLSLDDAVTKYLPAFRPKLADGRAPVITVRELLTHTSGLSYKFLEPADGPYHQAEVSDGLAEPGLSAEVNLARLASVPLVHEPGTVWNYSLSVDVLGEVVARAGGAPLPELLARLVTGPLGMTDTGFVVHDRARIAWPYSAGKPPVRMTEPFEMAMAGLGMRFSPARIFDGASFPSGGAGLAGTARDYLRFAEALRTGAAPVLARATAAAMRQSQLGAAAAPFLGPGPGFGFGVGIVLDPAAAKTPKGRGSFGWQGAYGTDFWIDPEAQMSVVILTNVAGLPGLQLENAIYEGSR